MGLREPAWSKTPFRIVEDRAQGELLYAVDGRAPDRWDRKATCALVYAVLEAAQRMGWCESGRLTSGDGDG